VWTVEAGDYLGTAFAFSRTSAGETLLVTNFHVVAATYNGGGRSVGLKHGDTSYSGQIVAASEDDDLVAISVPATIPLLTRATGNPTVGDPVLSIGSPLGLSQTVTTGVVSALRDGMVQFSAPISPGNSGGPVIDRNGNVVGVAEKKYVGDGAEGLGFAISIATVCKTVVTC
jgi:putative serine protease PepD